ncbi:MAG: ATP-grasp domain-containing protein [Bacteroidetes bacterium]|nr:ATP-grasp domain-containing protein [Bacteroidota bacterium]
MCRKRILVIHSDVPPDAPPDELDVLHEAAFMAGHLKSMGHEVSVMPFTADLKQTKENILNFNPDFIFNLVETMFGSGRLIHVAPSLFGYMNIPYTGCPADAIYNTSNKLTAKKIMHGYGIPTAKYLTVKNIQKKEIYEGESYIIKSVWEHASVGIDEQKFKLLINRDEISDLLKEKALSGNESFAEHYIEGREFNISVLGGKNGPQVLPFAEIRFVDYPEGKPKVVGYRAKWDESSFEFNHTVRSFDYTASDRPLHDNLRKLCLDCWNVFNLKGYARVDFRVDAEGNPFVLEINANPCISPDSGFIAACNQAEIPVQEVVKRILEEVCE